jgi:glycosyltransferase involved in cell wall biosynthesis
VSEPAFDVAVVIPVRDGAAYLGEALASVLGQDLPAREVVVVDDGSTDASAEVARAAGAGVRVVAQAPLGAGAARNRGVAETRAEWIAFLDADDRWLPSKLRLQRDAVRATPGATASTGSIRQFFSPDLGRTGTPNPEVLEGTTPTALLVRREAFLATGGFSTDPRAAEAAEWWVRFRESAPVVAIVPHVVAERRIHARNRGVVERDLRQDYVRIAKAMLDRRRPRERGD